MSLWRASVDSIQLVKLESSKQYSVFLIIPQEAEQAEPRSAEGPKKPKAAIASTNKRPKKETKKKR